MLWQPMNPLLNVDVWETRGTRLTHSVEAGIGQLTDDSFTAYTFTGLHLHCGAHLKHRKT